MMEKTQIPATEIIWEKFSQRLKYFILSEIRQEADADDVLQDVFIKIHTNIHSLRDGERLTSWLYQVTRNAIQDFRRKSKRTPPIVQLRDSIISTESEAPADFAKCLLPFMNSLPEKYRQAVQLADLRGIDQQKLATRLGISYSGAKSRVQRGRKLLLEKLVACCKNAGSRAEDLSCVNERSCECAA